MTFRTAALSATLASCTLMAIASPPNRFRLIYTGNGKSIGQASYSIDSAKNGLKLHSTFNVVMDNGGVNDLPTNVSMGNSRGGGSASTDVTYSSEYRLNADGSFQSGYTQSNTTQAMIVIDPSKSRDAVTIRQTRMGTEYGSQTVTVTDPVFFLFPNFDPGAIQALITGFLSHPHPDKRYLLLVPANPDLGQNDNSAGITSLESVADAEGTLNGSPVILKHYILRLRQGKAELYTDPAGNLMEAIVDPIRASYVRDKFTLAAGLPATAPNGAPGTR